MGTCPVPWASDAPAAQPTRGRGEGAGGHRGCRARPSSAAEGKSAERRAGGFLRGARAGQAGGGAGRRGGQGDLPSPSPKQKPVAAEPARGCAVTRAGR